MFISYLKSFLYKNECRCDILKGLNPLVAMAHSDLYSNIVNMSEEEYKIFMDILTIGHDSRKDNQSKGK